MSVTVRDNGADGLLARCRKLARGARVRVGILDDAPKQGAEGSPLSLVEVAALHEFGAPSAGIPQRSFLRATVDEQRPEIGRLQHSQAVLYFEGKIDARTALDRIGMKVASMVQARIARGIDPPLAARTIAAKGSSKPLVDTGQLKSAITWKVED